ncbi:MAG: S46 family peptidase [Prevotella sp.]|nr:S46 family peptidase [Prevotella sp.]
MRRTIFAFLLPLLSIAPMHADEGMWTLYDLPQAVYDVMKTEGYQLPYEKLYQADDAIMKAVVNFSGYCSGVVVSPDGLVFTNHHCGFEAIRSHSTVEHDYMLNGFCAKSYEEELPNKNMFVSFMVEQKDVTDQVITDAYWKMSTLDREDYLDSLENAWSKDVKAKDSTLRLELKPFYEGNRYFATTYRDFTDLRLVFAIPKSMGKFGGETDNWMWPRQTCDFSVFRIYADPKTGGPAAYSKDNVPYHPKHWARVSMDGYQEGSFSMTMGYPGSTSRYLSSYGIQERYAQNAIRAQVRGVKQEVMKRHMDASEAVRIKYDSKYAQSSNYWKNSIGMNKCIDSIGLIGQKQRFEQQLQAWIDSTGHFKGQLDFQKMEQLYRQRLELSKVQMNWGEAFARNEELSKRALRAQRSSEKDKKGKRYVQFEDNNETFDLATDKEILVVMLKNYRQHVTDQRYVPAFYTTIDTQFGGDYAKFVEQLYKSRLMKNGKRLYKAKKSFKKDLGVQYGQQLYKVFTDLQAEFKKVGADIDEQERLLCAAKLRMEQDMPHYSDANFTMRLSYGQVKEYNLGGQPSGYYTAAPSMYKKMLTGDRIEDYRVEPEMKTLLGAKDFGQYTDPKTREMQLCFLTTNDITGGNSGSPMFDGQNRLIGLAFDGNWDSLSSDIFFDSQLARCIGVDIRYVLFMMDRWGHADRLLQEINR